MAGFLDPYCRCLHNYCQTYLPSIVTQHVKELTAFNSTGMEEQQIRVVWVERAHALAACCEAIARLLPLEQPAAQDSTSLPPIEKWEPLVVPDPVGENRSFGSRIEDARRLLGQFEEWLEPAEKRLARDREFPENVVHDAISAFARMMAPYTYELTIRLQRLLSETKSESISRRAQDTLARLDSAERLLPLAGGGYIDRFHAFKEGFQASIVLIEVQQRDVPHGWLYRDDIGFVQFQWNALGRDNTGLPKSHLDAHVTPTVVTTSANENSTGAATPSQGTPVRPPGQWSRPITLKELAEFFKCGATARELRPQVQAIGSDLFMWMHKNYLVRLDTLAPEHRDDFLAHLDFVEDCRDAAAEARKEKKAAP